MKNTVGVPARKENFYPREREIIKITNKINDGNNLQIAAPRRVGKTSILFSLLDNKTDGNIYVYVDTEAVDTAEEFFKKILKEILKTDDIRNSSKLKKHIEEGNKFLKKIKSLSIMGNEISFNDSEEKISYKEELENLLSGIQLDENKRLILLIDEFPQTIQNIIERNDTGIKDAISFLQTNRDLRLNPEINDNVTFLYTGSIGLNHTVSAIDGTAFINDINSIEIGPLSLDEATDLLNNLLQPRNLIISNEVTLYLMQKIEWLIPFHIQLAVQEIIDLVFPDKEITKEIIDDCFTNIIATRNNNHFEHYSSRLKKSFKDNEYTFAYKLLCTIADKGTISKGDAFDMAVGLTVQNNFRNIVETLMYDGYINNNQDKEEYRFNSPVLRMWWNRFN